MCTLPAGLPLATVPRQRAGPAPQGAPIHHRISPAQALPLRGLLRPLCQGQREGALLPDRVQHPPALQSADAPAAGGAAAPGRGVGGCTWLPCSVTGRGLLQLPNVRWWRGEGVGGLWAHSAHRAAPTPSPTLTPPASHAPGGHPAWLWGTASSLLELGTPPRAQPPAPCWPGSPCPLAGEQ